jgi:hypothetical protein
MQIYSALFDSLIVDCLERMGIRHGIIYTTAMLALGLGFCLNLLSIIDLLWALGVLDHPYTSGSALHPQHYVYGLLCCGFVANAALARIKFSRDCRWLHLTHESQAPQIPVRNSSLIRSPGPAYVASSAVVILATATLNLVLQR